jgi:hypothetical protein
MLLAGRIYTPLLAAKIRFAPTESSRDGSD